MCLVIISILLQALGLIFDLLGVVLILRADNKKIILKPDSLADKICPILIKDHVLDPTTIFNERYGHPHKKKMRKLKNLGIGLIILGAVLIVSGTIMQVFIYIV